MKFRFTSPGRPERVAKLVRRELAAAGIAIGHGRARDVAARAFGYGTFHELGQLVGRGEPSAWDDEVDGAVREARRRCQVAAIAAVSDANLAARIVDRIAPTARRLGGGIARGRRTVTLDGILVRNGFLSGASNIAYHAHADAYLKDLYEERFGPSTIMMGPGMGKTHALRMLAKRLEERGLSVHSTPRILTGSIDRADLEARMRALFGK